MFLVRFSLQQFTCVVLIENNLGASMRQVNSQSKADTRGRGCLAKPFSLNRMSFVSQRATRWTRAATR